MTGLPQGGDFPLYDTRVIFDLLFPLSVPDGHVVRGARVKKWSKMWRGVTSLTLAHSSHVNKIWSHTRGYVGGDIVGGDPPVTKALACNYLLRLQGVFLLVEVSDNTTAIEWACGGNVLSVSVPDTSGGVRTPAASVSHRSGEELGAAVTALVHALHGGYTVEDVQETLQKSNMIISQEEKSDAMKIFSDSADALAQVSATTTLSQAEVRKF